MKSMKVRKGKNKAESFRLGFWKNPAVSSRATASG